MGRDQWSLRYSSKVVSSFGRDCLFQKFASHDIELSGLEFDVVNLMSDLLSHWLSVPRSYRNPLGFSFFLLFFLCCDSAFIVCWQVSLVIGAVVPS